MLRSLNHGGRGGAGLALGGAGLALRAGDPGRDQVDACVYDNHHHQGQVEGTDCRVELVACNATREQTMIHKLGHNKTMLLRGMSHKTGSLQSTRIHKLVHNIMTFIISAQCHDIMLITYVIIHM